MCRKERENISRQVWFKRRLSKMPQHLQNIIEHSCIFTIYTHKTIKPPFRTKLQKFFSNYSAAWTWATCQKWVVLGNITRNNFHLFLSLHIYFVLSSKSSSITSQSIHLFSPAGFLQLSSSNGSCFHFPSTTIPGGACQSPTSAWLYRNDMNLFWARREKKQWIERI